MKQLNFRDTFNPKNYRDLNKYKKKSILDYQISLKENIHGTLKGRTVAGGKNQMDFISKEDSSLPTVSTEAVILSCIIYSEEEKGTVL